MGDLQVRLPGQEDLDQGHSVLIRQLLQPVIDLVPGLPGRKHEGDIFDMSGLIRQQALEVPHDPPAPVDIGQDGRGHAKAVLQHPLGPLVVIADPSDKDLPDHIGAGDLVQNSPGQGVGHMLFAHHLFFRQVIGIGPVGSDEIADPRDPGHLGRHAGEGPAGHRHHLHAGPDRRLQRRPAGPRQFLLFCQEGPVQVDPDHSYCLFHLYSCFCRLPRPVPGSAAAHAKNEPPQGPLPHMRKWVSRRARRPACKK